MRKGLKKLSSYKWLLYFTVLPVFLIGYKLNNILINSFGCFDDCHVFSTAYFMLQGKTIYKEIFFNHNPLMPYLSFVIQYTTEPKSIYELLLEHRRVIFIFSIVFDILLLIRFRFKALGFILVYELTKFYTFGNRFLPEALIVYPLVYLLGVCFEKIKDKSLKLYDLTVAPVAVWFVVFMREPYVPLALILYAVIIGVPNKKQKIISLGIFLLLTVFTLLTLPISDYYYNVVTFNFLTLVGQEVTRNNILGIGFLKIFFYPFFILLPLGNWGFYRQLLAVESIFFLFVFFSNIKNKPKFLLIFIVTVLGISNLRIVDPGTAFYEAYHMNVWYALFIFSGMFLWSYIKKNRIFIISTTLFVLILLFSISNKSIIWDKIDRQEQLITNYGSLMMHVQLLEKISEPNDTLFLDGWDELIYSQAKLPSSYKYSQYTSLMPMVDLYTKERLLMFQNNPPSFYYGSCKGDVGQKLPPGLIKKYIQVYYKGSPTCLYVYGKKYEKIKNSDNEITFENE